MKLDREQQNVLSRALKVARRKGASPRVQKALVEALLVESGARHLDYGDRDSVGVLQQRPSQGWGPAGESVETDVAQFLQRAMQTNRGFKGSAGQLAQAVQRSAYPGRYDQRGGDAAAILGNSSKAIPPISHNSEVIGGGQDRQALLAQYLLQRDRPDALTNALLALQQEQQPNPESRPAAPTSDTRGGSTDIEQLLRVAQRDFGLRISEHPSYDKVDPVHTKGSYHYRKAKRSPGAAADLTGSPKQMAAFAQYVARNYGADVEELIYRGRGGRTIKHGKRVPRDFYSKHEGHVHVADTD